MGGGFLFLTREEKTMTDQNAATPGPASNAPTELELLKKRAEMMGIDYHPNIGLDKLKQRVADAMSDDETSEGPEPEPDVLPPIQATVAPGGPLPLSSIRAARGETEQEKRMRLHRAANKLVRCRVACMNPNKTDWSGEIFTASNSVVGTIKKYVQFNADEGWHIPQFILNVIRDRKVQIWINGKDGKGRPKKISKMIKEFNVEVMPDLREEELKELATQQAMSHSIDA